MGWGRDELGDYKYWGGNFDLENYLKEQGFDVYTLSVGPVSSNWDRAIEAYYQIKGGKIDYGVNHSEKYELIRKPNNKDFSGLYTIWNQENPIHIIAHSQGGQTARMLEYLLQNKFKGEESELLNKQKTGWIKSVTTIATPHNGTTLAPIINNMFPYIQSLVIWFDIISPNSLYDLDLDQWGFYQKKDESLYDYVARLRRSPISFTENFCSYDLSLIGSEKFNKTYITDPEVYYFSYSTTNNNNPKLIYKLQSNLMTNSEKFPSEWRENDGIVNTISMLGPSNSNVIEYKGLIQKGIWQHMGKIDLDHNEIIGHHINDEKLHMIKEIYQRQCRMIYTLD